MPQKISKKTAGAKTDPANNPKDPVMDVSHPENAQPDATSRPIIVTRKPIMQDPMVRADSAKTEIPGPPVLSPKTSKLHAFLTPKKSAGAEAASEMEIAAVDTAVEQLSVEEKIAQAKVKVDEADAKTIEQETPEELKSKIKEDTKAAIEVKANNETPEEPVEQNKPSATKGMPAAVKEIIQPEDVHISGEPLIEEAPTEDSAETTPKPTTGKKIVPIKVDLSPKKATPAKKADELKDINDAPSEESAKALKDAIKVDGSKDTKDKPANSEESTESTEEAEDTPSADSTEKTEDQKESDPNKEQKSSGLVDELAKQAADKKSKGKEEKELSAKQQKINKLVEDKTYFLPIGEVTRKRKNRNSLLVFLLFLTLLAGAYAAADAGLVQSPVDLPYEFIQN